MHLKPTSPTRPMTPNHPNGKHSLSRVGMWVQNRIHDLFLRDESRCRSPEHIDDNEEDILRRSISDPINPIPAKDVQSPARPIGIGLPRQATFKRTNSERRERLCPVSPRPEERRAISSQRQKSTSLARLRTRARSSPPPNNPAHRSEPTVGAQSVTEVASFDFDLLPREQLREDVETDGVIDYDLPRPARPLSRTSSLRSIDDDDQAFAERALLNAELDTRWILNLSMHFRDKSDREKFFVTYAETPTNWRRVTVSCDYRNAELGSLEKDLKELSFQRDKSLQIYEAIRESLPEIQFYDTVTNLKLETSDGRLHVHVTEDVNEIVLYPPRSMLRHILDEGPPEARPMEMIESEVAFEAHLSGFVYRVSPQGKTYIKKEIPGPDTIDEFLYEVNALHALHSSENVINLEAIIMDDRKEFVKGLLITYAAKGAIVDLLYDHKGLIPWSHREKWAKQAILGLRDIHEEGYVQGDFTLSNIVIDENNDAKIIDINRRGCPVGWEPPEIARKIASNQRISMYIGEKSDLYQLGMTLWALAMDDDEPERHDPPLSTDEFPAEVPNWYQDIARICLSSDPRCRLSAKELVKLFPVEEGTETALDVMPKPKLTIRTQRYINPAAAVERDDLERFRLEKEEPLLYSPQSSKEDYTYTFPKSSSYSRDYEDRSSTWEGRGRRPASNIEHLSAEERARRNLPPRSIERTFSDTVAPNIVDASPDSAPEYDVVNMDGHRYLVSRGTFNSEELKILNDLPDTAESVKLSPTALANSPSPLHLPHWRRSASESTPRNSYLQLTPMPTRGESRNNSLDSALRKTCSSDPQPRQSFQDLHKTSSADLDRGVTPTADQPSKNNLPEISETRPDPSVATPQADASAHDVPAHQSIDGCATKSGEQPLSIQKQQDVSSHEQQAPDTAVTTPQRNVYYTDSGYCSRGSRQ